MTNALASYFTAQLDLQRTANDGGCFRSEREGECFDSGVDLESGHYENLSLEICRACHRPRMVQMPAHLGEAAGVAARLSRMHEGGAVFNYPGALTPMEWCCLDALQIGRGNDSEAARRNEKEKADTSRRSAELSAAINR